MKKIILSLVVLVASFIPLESNAVTVVEKDMGFVSVSATATKEVNPDTATITFAIENSATDSKDAVNKNKEMSTKLYDSISPLLSLDKSDVMQTKNFVLKPNYTQDKNGKKTFVNYTASNILYVKTKDLDKISKLIDIASENAATTINELNFYLEDEKKFEGELAKEALSNAQVIASMTASTLGQKIKGIRAVRVNIYPQGSGAVYGLANVTSKPKSTPVEAGKIKLQANVNAEFYVK